ncbi:nitrogen fixation protein NifQ [Wolinella succinogenes]|nr:nitrogen fixation protein NifQ [Wolinella succinogenes]
MKKILAILQEHAASPYAKEVIAPMIAERAYGKNHLYEDMGFPSRKDYNAFMAIHFPLLAQEKPKEKRWKKFLFDTIGEIAPACAFCGDTDECFSCDLVV